MNIITPKYAVVIQQAAKYLRLYTPTETRFALSSCISPYGELIEFPQHIIFIINPCYDIEDIIELIKYNAKNVKIERLTT